MIPAVNPVFKKNKKIELIDTRKPKKSNLSTIDANLFQVKYWIP